VIFTALELNGAFVIDQERRADHRGFFARTWCADEFARHGLDNTVVQVNTGFSPAAGTLRGMHLQTGAHAEVKVARCTRGAVFDVIVDLRHDSPTFCKSYAAELTADNGRMLYVPKGFAHGYQTLVADSELLYSTSAVFAPGSACGVRYDDPRFDIHWPLPVSEISAQDRTWLDFGPGHPAFQGRQE
jgi:dTDP-4-dehydrorhamnose 3,5-epimerase